MKICFTVTNDLSFDQRMIRIASSLAKAGHDVTVVGRRLSGSNDLAQQSFQQNRLRCVFKSGKRFYTEYNLRLFLFLLSKKYDCLCAIDLDTIMPVLFVSKLRRVMRVYDAHELFCEMQEIVTRPTVYRTWKKIEKYSVPQFYNGYTVNKPIADEFNIMYKRHYEVIRNLPVLSNLEFTQKIEKIIIYQGAVNEGRSFETLIPAMKFVNAALWIFGKGNHLHEAIKLRDELGLEEKVFFKGMALPDELKLLTREAKIGITLFERKGLSNYLSLANRFFDYIEAGTPQVCVNFPAYAEINARFEVAVLIDDLSPATISEKLSMLLNDHVLYDRLRQNCLAAREFYNWQVEEKKLLQFYDRLSIKKNANIGG